MKKAQISLEALMAMAVIILVYGAIVAASAGISSKAGQMADQRHSLMDCDMASALFSYAGSSGPGSAVKMDFESGYKTLPARIISETDDSMVCVIDAQNITPDRFDAGTRILEVTDDGFKIS